MKIWILFVVLVSFKTFAFPEMVRHHYNNCIACHESPSGGGLLTQYGRTISATALSTWGSEREARAIYGATDVQWVRDYFNAGVDLRAVQFHQATPTAISGQFIRMQTALESSLRYENFKIVGSFGKQEEKNMVRGEWTKFYAMGTFIDQLTVRVGRFIPNFGLNIAEHIFPTRRSIELDQGTERDQVEGMWNGEEWNSSLTFHESPSNDRFSVKEKGITATANYFFLNSNRVGLSYWESKRENEATRKRIFGVNGVFSLGEQLYYLTEFDQVHDKKKRGLVHFSKLGMEIFKGFHGFLYEDYKNLDLSNGKGLVYAFGAGINFYPRPHYDFQLMYQKKKTASYGSKLYDYAYLMYYIYL